MPREFSDATGERWTATETGFYFGDDDGFPQDEAFSDGVTADVEFRSERGRRVTAYMSRGAVDRDSEEQLRAELAKALQEHREVQ